MPDFRQFSVGCFWGIQCKKSDEWLIAVHVPALTNLRIPPLFLAQMFARQLSQHTAEKFSVELLNDLDDGYYYLIVHFTGVPQ